VWRLCKYIYKNIELHKLPPDTVIQPRYQLIELTVQKGRHTRPGQDHQKRKDKSKSVWILQPLLDKNGNENLFSV
jgi:hypothetical protein